MIRVFTLNKNNKIELTKEELESLLNDSYWDGYKAGSGSSWIYTSPNWSSSNATVTNPVITLNTDTTTNPNTITFNTTTLS